VEYKDKIYLDYAASTPVDQRVLGAMLPYFTDIYGNPSSIHYYGQQAENALENARDIVAKLVHANPGEIIFTSCGTESDNLALRGTAFAQRKKRNANHILISPVEHHAVLHTAHQLAEQNGFEVEYLPVDKYGMIDPSDVEAYLRSETAVVSIIYANNEIGTINPIAEIGGICQKHGVPFHTDAVQAAAHLSMDVQRDGLDLMALGAHKFYGPKGVGALFVRNGLAISPVQTGGKQESGLRGGTQNVPFIIGMSEALKITNQECEKRANTLIPMRDKIVGTILEEIPHTLLTGHPNKRLPNHASFVFEGVDGNALLMMLDMAGFACSSGSACKVGIPKPSEVLTAIGLSSNWALGSLRITLGKETTTDNVEAFLEVLPKIVEKTRSSK